MAVITDEEERQVPLEEHNASGRCYWSRCPDQATKEVTFEDTEAAIRVCNWHAWPYEHERSRPCEVRPI